MFYGKDRLTRAQLREVIRKAELLEASDAVTQDEVRAIAAELGISEWSVERALTDFAARGESLPVWKRPAVVAGGTFVTGMTAAALLVVLREPMPQPFLAYTALSTLVGLTCLSATLGFKAYTGVAHRRFQLSNLTLWAGFGFFASINGGNELAIPGFVIGTVVATLGWLANRRAERLSSGPGEPSEPQQHEPSAERKKSWWAELWPRMYRRGDHSVLRPTTVVYPARRLT